MNRPSLRQLEYFVAVAHHRSFSRAAGACFVTQPGLSAQVQQLEAMLLVPLFERTRPAVLLTAAGEALLPKARAILAAVDEMVASARGLSRPLTGTLRLGVIPTIAPYLLPEVLPAVRRRYPDLRLLLREEKTDVLVRELSDGRLDLVLLALEANLGDAETRVLFSDPFVLAVPRRHRLAKRKRVDESDLTGENVLLLDDSHCLRGQALSLCEAANASEVGDFRASGLSTLVQMVASGVGVTLLPSMAVAAEIGRTSALVVLPFARGAASRTIGLAWRRSSPRAAEFELLAREFMRAKKPQRAPKMGATA